MKKFGTFLSNLLSSGLGVAGLIIFIAFLAFIFFYGDNKASMVGLSTATKISPQEEIRELKKEIKVLQLKLNHLKEGGKNE